MATTGSERGVNFPVDAATEGLQQSKLYEEYLTRLPSKRDMRMYITAQAETGVGKTTLAFALAMVMDVHGWSAEKATLDPREYSSMYDQVPAGSVLILDEAEQALDKRRGMSQETIDVGHDFATKRYRQIIGILTLPSRSWMDKRVSEDMADYWIQCLATDDGKPKGEARVYRLQNNEHYETNYTKRTETITWPRLDDHPEFKRLDRKKRERMEGGPERNYWHKDEVEEVKGDIQDRTEKKVRYHLVRAMSEYGLNQTDISEILAMADHVGGLGQSRISHIVNSDAFSEVYD